VISEEDEQAAPAGTPILLIAFSVLGSGIITDRFAPEADSSIDWAAGIEEIRQSPDRQH
jgi:hypothetical protein